MRENLALIAGGRQAEDDPPEEALQILSEGVPLVILILDASGRVMWLTDAARSRFGHDAGPARAAATTRRALEELGARVREAARARRSAALRCTVAGEGVSLRRFEASTGQPLYLATYAAGHDADPRPSIRSAVGRRLA